MVFLDQQRHIYSDNHIERNMLKTVLPLPRKINLRSI